MTIEPIDTSYLTLNVLRTPQTRQRRKTLLRKLLNEAKSMRLNTLVIDIRIFTETETG